MSWLLIRFMLVIVPVVFLPLVLFGYLLLTQLVRWICRRQFGTGL